MNRFRSISMLTIAVVLLSATLGGCTKLARSLASLRTNYDTSGTQYTSGNFRLYQVLPSQQSAGSQFDMIGQSNEFDTYCGDASAPCLCEYTYVQGGVTQSSSVASPYQESNLLRCPNQVPSGISSFDVRIVTADNASFSNAIAVNLNNGVFAGSTMYLDLTNSSSFVQAKRFQCRKHEFIPNPMDGGMVDPIQSEDPKVIYPFNFYTTNVSESLLQMQRLADQNWECTLIETQDRSIHWWANANVFSADTCTDAFCAGDGELMYPQNSLVSGKIPVTNPSANGKRRGSFWLAKQSYGVFQIPLQVALAPKDYVSSTYGVIGYAAKPIPTSGTSVCPSITLPTNATWVKLWNYRATDITPPKKVTGSNSVTLSTIACNPTADTVFPTCSLPKTPGGSDRFGYTPTTRDPASDLTSRVGALDSAYGNANACYNVDALSWGTGLETWAPGPIGFGNPTATPDPGLTAAQIRTLPWNLYGAVTNVCTDAEATPITRVNNAACPAAAAAMNVLPNSTPSDSQIVSVSLADDNYTDQIFVVTDPAVDDNSMRNQSPGVAHYRPITYRTSNDCPGVSKSDAGGGVPCAVSKELHWDVSIKEVGNAGSADLYPLCVLQFYD